MKLSALQETNKKLFSLVIQFGF